jgi:hypothetical protein
MNSFLLEKLRLRNEETKISSTVTISVADLDNFDTDPDPDPTSEKNLIRILLNVKFCNKKFLLKNAL